MTQETNLAAPRRSRVPEVLIALVSAAALGFLFYLIYGRDTSGSYAGSVAFLPALNAACNAVTTLLIILGLRAIWRGDQEGHRRRMLGAFATSTLFLIGYIVYHSLHGETRFPGTGWVRPVYFFILISHIVLSAIALPMILTTFWFALSRQFTRHVKLARWTYPIWLYVSVTGVVGFCFGGTLAYHVGARHDPDALVCYYGSGVPGALGEADHERRLSQGGATQVLVRFGERVVLPAHRFVGTGHGQAAPLRARPSDPRRRRGPGPGRPAGPAGPRPARSRRPGRSRGSAPGRRTSAGPRFPSRGRTG
jgi:putative membrane protein